MPDPTLPSPHTRGPRRIGPRRRIAALLLAGTAVAGLTGVVSPTAASAASAAAQFESSTISHTNAARTSNRLAAVKKGSCLQELAEAQAKRMAAQQRLFHQDLGPVLTRCHRTQVAENIAYGYSSGTSVVDAWTHSPGHRANILHSGYQRIGVGAVQDAHGRWWVSEVFGRA